MKLVRVDVYGSPRLQQRFSVLSVPTLFVLHRAQIIARQAGVEPKDPLRMWLSQALQASLAVSTPPRSPRSTR